MMTTDDSTKLYLKEQLEEERKESNGLYAKKIVEVIVFGFVALICVGVVGSLMALVIK